MSNERITELDETTTIDGMEVVVDSPGAIELKKFNLTTLKNHCRSAAEVTDATVAEAAGLTAEVVPVGDPPEYNYVPDEATEYLTTADFAAAGVMASLKNADKLLDAVAADHEERITDLEANALPAGMSSIAFTVELIDDETYEITTDELVGHGMLSFYATEASPTLLENAFSNFYLYATEGSYVSSGTNFSNANTDGKMCLYWDISSGTLILKNRMGYTATVVFTGWFDEILTS